MCEEKRVKICLPVRSGTQTGLIKAGYVVNSGAMDKFPNEKQANYRLFNLHNRFFKGFF